MITFIEHSSPNYRDRTIENIRKSDVTLAFAIDFNTHGEKLTRTETVSQGKIYIPIDFNNLNVEEKIVHAIKVGLNRIFQDKLIINIAGNGIYSLPFNQKVVDELVHILLKKVVYCLSYIGITEIEFVTGGQTGADESGTKAADKLGFPITVLAPQGWKFRDITGKDISNEELFKERFKTN